MDNDNISIMLANILTSNNKYRLVLDLINRESPDIVAIQEVDNIWTDQLSLLKKTYPYYFEHPRTDNFGLSVYSKLPLRNINLNHYSYARTS
ncbi:MAG: endonuclease/exonuclease/phosphatase family protein, partial [Cyanobacteriota bacterium]